MYPYNFGCSGTASAFTNINMKRSISDDGDSSDCDDVFASDDINTKSAQMPGQNADGCHLLNRKKRRGMIEKRRRDRINNSLLELRRLVPAAFEKQGSAKLEKAEILQMTVDHLRMLHAKGFDAFSFDPHKFATDYHSIGFRECASEVARYMVAIEGMDLQDPLRLRLMSHLQCYSAQRELALKSASSHSGWNPSAFTTPQFAAPIPPTHPPSHSANVSSLTNDSMPLHGTAPVTSHYNPNGSHHHQHQPIIDGTTGHSLGGQSLMSHSVVPKSSGSPSPISSSMPIGYPPTSGPSISSMASSNHHHHTNAYFTSGYGAPPPCVPTSSSAIIPPQGASVKHYRPWGAELAY